MYNQFVMSSPRAQHIHLSSYHITGSLGGDTCSSRHFFSRSMNSFKISIWTHIGSMKILLISLHASIQRVPCLSVLFLFTYHLMSRPSKRRPILAKNKWEHYPQFGMFLELIRDCIGKLLYKCTESAISLDTYPGRWRTLYCWYIRCHEICSTHIISYE